MGDRPLTDDKFTAGYKTGFNDGKLSCQNTQEASGAKDTVTAVSAGAAPRKPTAHKPKTGDASVVQPLDKLRALLVKALHNSDVVIFKSDIVSLIRDNWLELSLYSHEIHERLDKGEDPYA